MKIGIMTAMDQEYEMARKVLANNSKHEIIPVHCGWGKVNSAVNAYKLISEHHPDCIISTGCAGGISKDVHLLDVVVGAQVAYHDCWYGEPNVYGQVQGFPARFEAHPTLLAAARSLLTATGKGSVRVPQGEPGTGIARPKANPAKLHFGLIASGDRFVAGPADNAFVLGHFPDALACDMESGSISQVCHMYDTPFMSMRVISDTAEEENRLGQFENFWETVGSESFEILQAFVNALPDTI
jgi:adenosylhomocysteine nucleosidase